jgi:hypothetical protein
VAAPKRAKRQLHPANLHLVLKGNILHHARNLNLVLRQGVARESLRYMLGSNTLVPTPAQMQLL